MLKKKVAVIFGGKSSEHEVSQISASAIISNLDKQKYDLIMIGINKAGEWFIFNGDIEDIKNGNWENNTNNKKAFITPDSRIKGIIVLDNDKYKIIEIDAVIPALHGKNGEDGTIQGLFQMAEIPFVGCDTVSSAACMDKVITNTMLTYHGINKAKFYWFYSYEYKINPEMYIEKVDSYFNSYPLFVKPANAGSSVGISKVESKEELISAINTAAKEDYKILIEENILGQEVECAVLGNESPIASIIGEIAPSSKFYDYDDKYLNGTSQLYIPAHVSESISDEIRKTALKAYSVMGCKGLSRVDFFVQKDTNKVFLNEINTFPGFTPISMYPKLMEKMGFSFSSLLDKLIELSIEKKK